jgi:probable F420-dependent oxidoreductase
LILVLDIGVFLPNYGPMATREFIVDVARKAEELGFRSAAVCDHLFIDTKSANAMTNVGTVDAQTPGSGEPNWYDALSTLAYVAGITEKIRLVTNVYVLPLRHPLQVAREVTTLDVLSKGRVDLGIGVGWYPDEFEAVGVGMDARGEIMDEAIGVLKQVWTEKRPSFNGRYTKFRNIQFYPKPVQKPHPPIYIGGYITDGRQHFGVSKGRRPPALVRAAKLGDGWIPCGATTEEVRKGVAIIQELTREMRRNPRGMRIISHNMVSTGKTLQEAKRTAAVSMVQRFGSVEAGMERAILGTTSDAIRRFEDYVKAGVTDFLIGFFAPTPKEVLSKMKMFSREILPSLR